MARRFLLGACAGAVCAMAFAQSAAHEALKKEIAALREKPAVCELPA